MIYFYICPSINHPFQSSYQPEQPQRHPPRKTVAIYWKGFRAHLGLGGVLGEFVAQLLELGLEVLQVLAQLDVLALILLETLIRLVKLHLRGRLRLAFLLVPGAF